jgi:MerR family transcriptional regulator, light-induced transcriptional regulator
MQESLAVSARMKATLAKNHSENLAEHLAARRVQFNQALLHGDTESATRAIDDLVAGHRSLFDIYLQVVAPALKSVGDSWCSGELGVGQEHLATQIVIEQMDRLRSLFVVPEPRSPYRVLVACVEGEQHFIGARMVADLCLLKGWAVDFLGPDTPASALVDMAKRRYSHLVALSATMEQGMTRVLGVLDELAALAPAPSLVLGGQLFAANATPVSLRRSCAIARDAAEGIDLIGKLLRADRPKAVLKEYLLGLGRRVRVLRTKKGWTQEHLAEVARVTRVCIVAVEGGKQNVSMDILVRLANALGVAPEVLLSPGDDIVKVPRRGHEESDF